MEMWALPPNKSLVRHEVACVAVVPEQRIQPTVLPAVPYQHVRSWQREGAKLLGQCRLIRQDGSGSMSGRCIIAR